MSLSCGGRGPCCHVGYPHRHCEHCDTVIALQHCHHYGWFTSGQYYTSGGIFSGLATQMQQLNALLPQDTIIHAEHEQ